MEELNTLLFDTKPRARMEAERIARNHLEYHLDGRCALIYLTRDEIEQSRWTRPIWRNSPACL